MLDPTSKTSQVLALLQARGVLRPRDLVELGIHPSNLAHLARQGLLTRTGRGLYTLAEGDWTEHHSLVEIAKRIPNCVIGLTTALRFHDLTDEMPFKIWIFISQKARAPQVDYPPVNVFRCKVENLYAEVIRPNLEGIEVCVTNVPRTIADCFRHRSSVGMDVAIFAMKEALRRGLCTPAEMASTAKRFRAYNFMRPYLEAIL